MSGVTMASFKAEGKTLSDSVDMDTRNSSRVLTFSFKSHVGSGSSEHDLFGAAEISLRTYSVVTGSKLENAWSNDESGSSVGFMFQRTVVTKLISTWSLKKLANISLSTFMEGETGRMVELFSSVLSTGKTWHHLINWSLSYLHFLVWMSLPTRCTWPRYWWWSAAVLDLVRCLSSVLRVCLAQWNLLVYYMDWNKGEEFVLMLDSVCREQTE